MQDNPYARNRIIQYQNNLTNTLEDLPPLESLNPDSLKDLSKQVLCEYLRAYGFVPGGSKPEMKKQMRTLIHSINTNTPIPQNAMTPQPKANDLMGISGISMAQQQLQSQPLQTTIQQPPPMGMNINTLQPGLTTAASIMNMGALPGMASPMGYMPFANQMAPSYHVQQHQQAQQVLHHHQQVQQQHLHMQQQQQQQIQPVQSIQSHQNIIKSTPSNETPSISSPPGSPSQSTQSKEEPDFCTDCTKKANKECSNHRCRGCCVKHMIDTKELCLVHIKDESRRPRTKEHPNADVIQALIQQAIVQFPHFSFGSTSNTPSTSTPNMISTPSSIPLQQPMMSGGMDHLSLGVSPLMVSQQQRMQQQQQQQQRTPTFNVATPAVPLNNMVNNVSGQKPMFSHFQQPYLQQHQQQQQSQQQQQQDVTSHKLQAHLQMHYINLAANHSQQVATHRMHVQRPDKFAFFTCPKCEKLLTVNGSQIWKHFQAEHPDLLIPLLKQKINGEQLELVSTNENQGIGSGVGGSVGGNGIQQILGQSIGTTNIGGVNSTSQSSSTAGELFDVLSLAKSAAQDRYDANLEWLEELFSPNPSPINCTNYNNNQNNQINNNGNGHITMDNETTTRKHKILEFEKRLEALNQFLENTHPPQPTESNNFYHFYNQLSLSKNIDELNEISESLEKSRKERNIHFESKPSTSVITQLPPQPNNPYYKSIEGERGFVIQNL